MMIPFNKSNLTIKSYNYASQSMKSNFHVGDGPFTDLCQNFFKERYDFKHTLLTTSCTHALEICAILLDFKKGDEIIMPSYTFVSCANAFIREGAQVVFCDSSKDSPNIDLNHLENLITPKTKAVLAVHYAGASCDMERLKKITSKNNLVLVEDAAQAVNSFYNMQPLGSFGDLSTFSFHGTKNISCGEGGLLAINNEKYIERSEIIREKGTNRKDFIRGKVDKYRWIDKGSSYLPSDLLAAVLYGQLQDLDTISKHRISAWRYYYKNISKIKNKNFVINEHEEKINHNGHIFYLTLNNKKNKNNFINYMAKNGVQVVTHYQSLHRAPYYNKMSKKNIECVNADLFTDTLVRLPLYPEIKNSDLDLVIDLIKNYCNQ